MPIILKIIFGVALLLVLLFSTFLVTPSSQYSEFSLVNIPIGTFKLSLAEKGKITKEKINSTQTGSVRGVFLNQVTSLDEIYYDSSDNFEINTKKERLVNLGEGKFFFSLNDGAKSYKIKGKGFDIEFLSVGELFIDATNPEEIMVFSISSTVELIFNGLYSDEKINSSIVFPHQYVKFNPKNNILLNGLSSYVEIQSKLLEIGIVPESIFNRSTEDMHFLFGVNGYNFLNTILEYRKKSLLLVRNNYLKLKSTSIVPFKLKLFLEEYLFVNEFKRAIYYKSNVLVAIKEISESKIVDETKIADIKSNLSLLKKIDQTEYENTLKIVRNYYNIYSLSSNLSDLVVVESLGKILNSTNTGETKIAAFSDLKSIFQNYDYYGKNHLSNNLVLFSKKLRETLLVSSEDQDKSTYDQEKVKNLQVLYYLSDYLNNYLLTQINKKDNLPVNIDLIGEYLILNKAIYYDNTTEYKRVGVNEAYSYLNQIEKKLRQSFFKRSRNVYNLLELKSAGENNDEVWIKKIKQSLSDFETVFVLNETMIKSDSDYKKMLKNLNEYLFAIESYENYELKYNPLLANDNKRNDVKIYKLTRADFMSYMKQFYGVELNSLVLGEFDEEYYKVESLRIGGKFFSFRLYPFDGHKMTNIAIGDLDNKKKSLTTSYRLEEIEKQWKENIEDESEDLDKSKYDFKKFFSIVFLHNSSSNNVSSSSTSGGDDNGGGEDVRERVYKRDVLLGKSGEFYSISDILPISYDLLDVDLDFNPVKISINSVKSTYIIDDKTSYLYEFNSDYTLSSTEHNFSNIELNVQLKKKDEQKYLLNGNYVYFVGKVDIRKIKEKLRALFNNMSIIQSVYTVIEESFATDDITVRMFPNTNKVKFEIKYKGEKLYMQLNENIIEYIYYGGDKLKEKMNYSSLKKALKDIIINIK